MDLKEQIVLFNQWQFDPNHRVAVSHRFRDLYYLLIEKFIDKNMSLSISGLRRVGKTTIIYQLINWLLKIRIKLREENITLVCGRGLN